ncbi:MAG: hypothetical protein ABJB12_07190 [Pseudomonadota bacterium]
MTTACQSLTVVVAVDDGPACRAALAKHRAALEAAFAEATGVQSACLALLPRPFAVQVDSLFIECSFRGSLSVVLGAAFALAESEFRAVFGCCAQFPPFCGPAGFAAYLSARAKRARASPEAGRDHWSTWRRARNALLARCHWPSFGAAPNAEDLEHRRAAVGMQDWQAGVPLLHVARLPEVALSRVKRALRSLEQDALLDPHARFLLHGNCLLFFAYPPQIAWLWAERVSAATLAPLTRVWAAVPGFGVRPWVRRARRARDLHRFLLDGRAPVDAWFNAQAPRPCLGSERRANGP